MTIEMRNDNRHALRKASQVDPFPLNVNLNGSLLLLLLLSRLLDQGIRKSETEQETEKQKEKQKEQEQSKFKFTFKEEERQRKNSHPPNMAARNLASNLLKRCLSAEIMDDAVRTASPKSSLISR
jgi:hypothetical protein